MSLRNARALSPWFIALLGRKSDRSRIEVNRDGVRYWEAFSFEFTC